MLNELGHFSLILAMVVALVQCSVPLVGAAKRWQGWMAVAEPAALIQLLLVGFSFAVLVRAFVTSDFSLQLVWANSNIDQPMLYKLTGIWGNHEGSMLLWILILALFGAAAALFGGNLPTTFRARVLAVQGGIGFAFLVFEIFTSNPFLRLAVPPFNGQDLNPLLQDPGLAIHPPFLYTGYVGLSMSFSFAVAALIEGRVDAAWGRWVRPWTLAAWMFLTVGIAMGSMWAYYELGWGGFWFWDPVENASFMPWLVAAALLHSAIVVEKRESLKSWTVLLAILAFGFSLVGAFITRSGVITSVHAFASDPTRGVALLILIALFMGGALTLFAARGEALASKGVFGTVSRESMLIFNNILLGVSAFVVFMGTIWPLIAEMAFGKKLSVGAPFFDMAFTPFMVALGVVLPVGAMLPWKRAKTGRVLKMLIPAAVLAVAVGALAWAMSNGRSALGPIGLMLGTWLVVGSFTDLYARTGKSGLGRLFRLPRADWGRVLAHAGLGVCIMGISGMMAWQSEDIRVVKEGDTVHLSGYDITLQDVTQVPGPNYAATRAEVSVMRNGHEVAHVYPEKRYFPIAGQTTTEAAIHNGFLRDIYVVVGDAQPNGGWAMRSYVKPLANWIWGGAVLMAFGGFLSLSDRRFRVAAGAAKARTAAGVPAE
ncbi:heme lyase CcmF/NrfE family subunit [Pseudooceanicola sp. CBS1P-1]|uniref:Heme lyase CcmF/NrfE family subunit n=1 Tax=Pseudooceanicola albus TaxID=2692189 RepID=A0A6L7G9J5_9RHOB|nr:MULTISPECIES: heme lyase CcmF/NrfE family subunit [Pseudooceanicola]MBT9384460.1 heme lyase CcmF/NrfE family subunit [Pseudooceanicola endophyticus]MXN20639.1 heme lyase CcmF/NrfE family subunit [Pseudooceanicola albus]